MSIIYSYPLKNENAQPDDLLVISDSTDKNRTKQIKVSQLPSGGGGGGGSVLLTTSGTTGQATLVGDTLNIPVYQGQLTITTTGSGAAVLTGDTLNIPENSYTLPLATSDARGGLKIGYTENGQNYPLELGTGADAEKGYVNVPWVNTTYEVATSIQAGIVKLGSDVLITSALEAGAAGEENRVFPVQINDQKQMAVFVPGGGTEYTLPPATNTALGGIKAAKITAQVPQPASSGDYYPVEILDSDSGGEDFCVVRVPTGSTSQPKIGFSPMSIYEARNTQTKSATALTFWIQHVVSSDTLINQVDFWSLNGGITGNVTIGVYTGVLNTTNSSSATLAAYGTAGVVTVGVNKVALTTDGSGNPASFSAGQSVVVMVSLNGDNAPGVLGVPGSQYPLQQVKLAMKATGFLTGTDLTTGDTITENLQTLFTSSGQDSAEVTSVDRFALHFYETDKNDGNSSGSGDVDDSDDSDDSDDGNTGGGDTGSGDGDTADTDTKQEQDGNSGDTGDGDTADDSTSG